MRDDMLGNSLLFYIFLALQLITYMYLISITSTMTLLYAEK